MGITRTTRDYEKWLGRHTSLIQADLEYKHQQMTEAVFPYMRATFYRWIGHWPTLCPELSKAPKVLAVGDLHVDNFGTWRDAQGRMVWGINDFDEAYPLAYTQDLVRLAASTMLSIRTEHVQIPEDHACRAIVDGYRECLEAGGRAVVVDEGFRWIAPLVGHDARDPVVFWKKMHALPEVEIEPPGPALKALRALMPAPKLELRISHRIAGLGSLGKPRYVAVTQWHGGPIARETKPLTPSATAWAQNRKEPKLHYAEILETAVRSPDPLFTVKGRWLARRLAPDCGRIELASLSRVRDDEQLLHAMGWETANVHLGTRGAAKAILRDLKDRRANWIRKAAGVMLETLVSDWNKWRKRVGKESH